MKKMRALAAATAISLAGVGAMVAPASATTTCTLTIGWYKQNPGDIGGPDLTTALRDGILAKTGKATLSDVLWAPAGGNADLIAAKQLIAAASNGAPGFGGFTGATGDAFYALASYFQGGPSLTRNQLTTLAGVLDDYNNGLREIPHCD